MLFRNNLLRFNRFMSGGGSRSQFRNQSPRQYGPSYPPPTEQDPPVARITTGKTTVSVGTEVSFDGSKSTGSGLKYSWNLGDGANPATPTTPKTSCTYSTTGEKTVSLVVTDDMGVESEAATLNITVIALTLAAKPETVTRGETATYTATVKPDDLNPTFRWEFTGGGAEVTEATGTTKTWTGQMVVSGTIKVTATVNGEPFTKTLGVNVSDRDWEIDIPFTMNDRRWGTAAPREYHDLGEVSMGSFTHENFILNTVPSGPNKDFKFVGSLNLSAPVEVRINQYFYHAKIMGAIIPQSWTDFQNAQGNESNEVQYADIEPAVRKHEGHPDNLKTDSHYTRWHVNVLQKGTDNDLAAQIERIVKPPSTIMSDYETHVTSEFNRITNKATEDIIKLGEPSDYLAGMVIDLTYPDPD